MRRIYAESNSGSIAVGEHGEFPGGDGGAASHTDGDDNEYGHGALANSVGDGFERTVLGCGACGTEHNSADVEREHKFDVFSDEFREQQRDGKYSDQRIDATSVDFAEGQRPSIGVKFGADTECGELRK